jgi:hypothetical protein
MPHRAIRFGPTADIAKIEWCSFYSRWPNLMRCPSGCFYRHLAHAPGFFPADHRLVSVSAGQS